MSKIIYQVEFLSDIVLPATSNTEGNIAQLDFIPGSNFLGMAAKEYQNFEDSFIVFHSGAVKFGDATILKSGKQTYKMPLSYFHEKLDANTIYNHHKIEDFSNFNQLKQKRNGYITAELEVAEVEYNYSQKSAYDKTKRRSLVGSMYGYNAIKSGTKWQFSIQYDENICKNDLELLKNVIVGKQKLGKSKSAQYGLVQIRELGVKENIEDKSLNELVIYANSRLALVDEDGNPTYDLKYLFDGLKDDNIDYPKCQIRTSTFTPYNGARATKDYERVCINKGSVIVLKGIDKSIIPNFVGAYQSEGFGEILLNPKFLSEDSFSFLNNNKNKKEQEKLSIKSDLAKFLMQREDTKKAKLDIANEVAAFIKNNASKYSKKMNSQWGTIRNLCNKESEKSIYDEVKEYISKGVAKEKWKDGKGSILLKAIENSNNPKEFTKLLAIQMPKVKNKKEQEND